MSMLLRRLLLSLAPHNLQLLNIRALADQAAEAAAAAEGTKAEITAALEQEVGVVCHPSLAVLCHVAVLWATLGTTGVFTT